MPYELALQPVPTLGTKISYLLNIHVEVQWIGIDLVQYLKYDCVI